MGGEIILDARLQKRVATTAERQQSKKNKNTTHIRAVLQRKQKRFVQKCNNTGTYIEYRINGSIGKRKLEQEELQKPQAKTARRLYGNPENAKKQEIHANTALWASGGKLAHD